MFPLANFVNHVLSQHVWARDKLRFHAGQLVRIEVRPAVLSLRILPTGDVETAPPSDAPNVTLSISATRLPILLADPGVALKEVRIDGDADLAQTVGQLVRELKWDAEEDLSKVLGDVAAYRLMQGVRAFQGWSRDASQRLAATTAAYLVDEQPTLVCSDMAEQFGRDVATLRDDFARLEKRLEALEVPQQPRTG